MPQRLPLQSPMPRPAHPVDIPSLHEPGVLHFQSDSLPWQRSLRWTEPPRDRRLFGFGLLLAVLITLLELVGFAVGMRSYRMHPQSSQVVQVILIEPEADLPPPPPEPEPPIVARPSRIAIAPPRVRTTPPPPPRPAEPSDAMSARIGEVGTATPAPQLFNPDGSIRLGTGSAPSLPQAPKNPQEAARARWAQIEQRGNPIDCRKTRFTKAFAPDESAGDEAARKYLKWIGLGDGEAIAHRQQQRAQAGGCEPAK